MYHRLFDTFTSRARVYTKAASEMLVQQRLNTMKELIQEYKLSVNLVLVVSNQKLADKMTCVPPKVA